MTYRNRPALCLSQCRLHRLSHRLALRLIPRLAASAVLGSILLAGIAPAQSPDPKFVVGDVASLTCRVVKLKRIETKPHKKYSYGSLVTVEVRNRGRVWAEPVSIRITAKKDLHGNPVDRELRRFEGSGFGRAGRAVRPGGSLTYELLSQHTLKSKTGVTASVTKASFFEGRGLDSLKIKTTRKKSETFQRGTVTRDADVYALTNPLDHPVDVAFQAKIRRPFKGRAIVRRRLEANEKARWKIEGYYFAGGNGVEGIEIQSLKLIDWSVIRDDGSRTAAKVFRDAYERWARWTKPVALSGRFECRTTSRSELNKKVETSDRTTRGRFQLGENGAFQIQPDDGETVDPARMRGLRWHFEQAFADIRRPPVDKVIEDNKLGVQSIGEKTFLTINGPTWSKWARSARCLKVDGTTLVGSGHNESRLIDWSVQQRGKFYVVTARDGAINSIRNGHLERFAYDLVGDHLVPVHFRSRMSFLEGSFKTTDLRLSDVRLGTGPQLTPPAPKGPGAEALAKVWNGAYRYPATGVTFSGRYVAHNDGKTEASWEGLTSAKGTFRFAGYLGGRYGHHQMTVTDKLSKAQAYRIGELVADRFRIWFFRDLNAREPFENAFAGATIEMEKPGVFRTTVPRFHKVIARDGRIHAVVDRSGYKRVFGYAKVGEHMVMNKITAGDLVCTAKFKLVNGRPVPVDMKFDGVFGKDWGPERIEVRAPSVDVDG